jgi:acyl-coenzyme A thioesterase PaaI-like protein
MSLVKDARFVRGAVRYSYDNGKTWTRTPRKVPLVRSLGMTITKVDKKRGVIELQVTIETD